MLLMFPAAVLVDVMILTPLFLELSSSDSFDEDDTESIAGIEF